MSGCSRGGVVGAVALALLTVGVEARAAEIETRDFQVTVAGKAAGKVHMTIRRHDDGQISMSCDTDIKVNRPLRRAYKFSYRGQEIWKAGRLVRFDSTTDDDGKRYLVSAVAEKNGVRVKVNNKERMVKPEVWLSSYWCLPDAQVRKQTLVILDADNGRDLTGKLAFVAATKKVVNGKTKTVHHYRLTGKITIDLWYDAADERLVRQEWVEDGHRMVVDLTGVRR